MVQAEQTGPTLRATCSLALVSTLHGGVQGEFYSVSEQCPLLDLILKGTESEKVYQLTWDDLRNAIIILCCVLQFCKPDCLFGSKLVQLLADENVAQYLRSDEFRDGALPLGKETAFHESKSKNGLT